MGATGYVLTIPDEVLKKLELENGVKSGIMGK